MGSSPAIGADGTIFVGSEDHYVYAINPADGTVKWKCRTGFYVESSPAVGIDGTVYIGTLWPDYSIYAINPVDGTLKWTYATGYWVSSSPAVGADGTVYFGSGDHSVYALNGPDGTVKWSCLTESGVDVSPAIGADGTVYVGSDDGKLYAFGGVGPSTYSVSGTVTLSGAGLAGVTMTLSPGGKTATTASDGTYKFTDILEGTCTLTPTATGYVFTPAQRSVTVKALDVTGQDFTATALPHIVSGAVTVSGVGLPGVKVVVSPGGQMGTTQADGTYQIAGVYSGNYTLSPYEQGYAMTPAYRAITVTTSDLGGQDFVAQVAAGLANTPWPKFRGNARNTGQSPYTGPQTNHLKWTFQSGGDLAGSSVAIGQDGTLYVERWDRYFYALDPADGSIKWKYYSGYYGDSSPAIAADGTVYFTGGVCPMFAMDPSDGTVKWTTKTDGGGPPSIGADGTVYGSDTNRLNTDALDPLTGNVRWSTKTIGGVLNSPAIGEDGTVYVETYWGNVYALDPADGSVKWQRSTGNAPSGVVCSPVIGPDGTIYAGSGSDGLYALNPGDGSVKWLHATWNGAGQPAVGPDGTVYACCCALSPVDGSVIWSGSLGGGQPVIDADGTLYTFGVGGHLFALSSSDGSLKWSSQMGYNLEQSIAIGGDGTLYVGSDDGKLYAFGP